MNYISNIEMFTVFIVRSKGIIQVYLSCISMLVELLWPFL